MTKSPTKEELLKKVAVLEADVEEWKSFDQRVRRNLSGFLGKRTMRFGRDEIDVLSWPDIYFEFGKLMANR